MEVTLDQILEESKTKIDKIYTVDMPKREIVHIHPLKKLFKLKSLNLSMNMISKFPDDFLEKNRSIKEVNVSCNSISDLTPLLNPGLVSLSFSFNQVTSLDNLKILRVLLT